MAEESIPKILHQWSGAKGDPFVIRESTEGEPLLSAGGRNAVPARNWRWPTEPLVLEVLRLAGENAEQRQRIALLESSEVRLMDDALAVAADRDCPAGEIERLRRNVEALTAACGEAEPALLLAPCGCSASGGFKCSRCKALAAIESAEKHT